jgi:hypothetical protein
MCMCSHIFTNPGITLPFKIDSCSYLGKKRQGMRDRGTRSLTDTGSHNEKQLK